MKRHILALLGITLLATQLTAKATEWTYTGDEGAQNWSKLSPDFAACSGKNQSPIDLKGFIKADLKPIAFSYKAGTQDVIDNGHTVQFNYAPGSFITLDGDKFELKQFHFHSPSENHINGQAFPMEGHIVHADKDGNLAVIAIMFKEGAANKFLSKIWPSIPQEIGGKNTLPKPFNVAELLPANHDYYRFSGSLTTPPCTEGVRWLVMKHPVTVSKTQIDAFSHSIHEADNRPIQPTNGRPVLQ